MRKHDRAQNLETSLTRIARRRMTDVKLSGKQQVHSGSSESSKCPKILLAGLVCKNGELKSGVYGGFSVFTGVINAKAGKRFQKTIKKVFFSSFLKSQN